jgi:lactocepin
LAVVAVLALLGAASVAVTASRGDGSGSAPPETTSIPAPTTSSTTPAPTTSSTTPAPTTTVPVPSAALTAFCSSATPGPDLQLPAVADTTDPAAAAGALAALRQRYAALAATTTAFLPEASAVLGPQATGLTPEELAATFADAFASLDAAVAANQTLVATSPAPRTPLDWSAAVLAIPPVLTLYATACLPPPAGSAPVGLPACLDAEGVKVPCAVPHSTEVFYLNGPASACADFLAANSPATVVDGAISHPEIAATVSASYGGRLHSCSLSFTAPRTGLFANLGG